MRVRDKRARSCFCASCRDPDVLALLDEPHEAVTKAGDSAFAVLHARCAHDSHLQILCFAAAELICAPAATCFPPKSKHIMFISLSLRGHVVPLARLATELGSRGHRISFAVHEVPASRAAAGCLYCLYHLYLAWHSQDGRDYLNKTGAKFVSLGRAPLSQNERRDKLRQV